MKLKFNDLSRSWHFLILTSLLCCVCCIGGDGKESRRQKNSSISYSGKVVDMFMHTFNGYMIHAYPDDELMPLSCKGRKRFRDGDRGDLDQAMGDFSLTLIDSLDTLVIMNKYDEFKEGVALILKNNRYDADMTVSVFEVTIRSLGGLLAAHLLAEDLKKKGMYPEYKGGLLAHAEDLGERLLIAFDSPTSIPWLRTNLKSGFIPNEDENTCLACAGSLLIEFATLSYLTKRSEFEDAVRITMDKLFFVHSNFGLMPSLINVRTGKPFNAGTRIGAACDSYFETLLKSYILFNDAKYLAEFEFLYSGIMKYTEEDDLYFTVHYNDPKQRFSDALDSLGAFWPGLQVLAGDTDKAISSHRKLYEIFKKNGGFIPEVYRRDGFLEDPHYFLRPEFTESTYMLYSATKSDFYIEVGKEIYQALMKCKTKCGFAAMKNIKTLELEDRMDSFFLAETLKYLYLLFAEHENVLNFEVDKYIFNTEAHLFLPFPAKHQYSSGVKTKSNNNMKCPNNADSNMKKLMRKYFNDIAGNNFGFCEIDYKILEVFDKFRNNKIQIGSEEMYHFFFDIGLHVFKKDGNFQLYPKESIAKSEHAASIGKLVLSKLKKSNDDNNKDTKKTTTSMASIDLVVDGSVKLRVNSALADFCKEKFKSLSFGIIPTFKSNYACESFVKPFPTITTAMTNIDDGDDDKDSRRKRVAIFAFRGKCEFIRKAINAADANAGAIIIMNDNDDKELVSMSGELPEKHSSFYSFFISKEDGARMLQRIERYKNATALDLEINFVS